MAAGDTHVIIVGGVSVNDPGGHDAYPWNFINPSGMWARIFNAKDPGSKTVAIVFAPPYETRVLKQVLPKHKGGGMETTKLRCDLEVFGFCLQEGPDIRYFLDIHEATAKKIGYTRIEVRTADELTDALRRQTKVVSLDYFGHSNDKAFFVQFSTTVAPGKAEVKWTIDNARKVPTSIFAPGAVVRLFGCSLGDPGGMAEQLRDLWKLPVYGSKGLTDYQPIGEQVPIPKPSADEKTGIVPPGNGYYRFDAGGGAGIKVDDNAMKRFPPP